MLHKNALVTGSTSGIGLAIAKGLVENGCDVIVTGSRMRENANSAIQEIQSGNTGKRVYYVQADLRQPDGTTELCQKIDKIFPDGIDILVNNAGQQHVCPVDEFPVKIWHEMISVNLTTPFLLTRHVIPKMKQKQWGRIINISSVMGIISQPGKAPYCSTKSGLNGMTRAIAIEGGPFGITCNAICPGFVDTPLIQPQFAAYARKQNISTEEGKQKFFAGSVPIQRAVNADEIAELAVFLCTSSGGSITGSPLTIDGGLCVQ